MKNLKFYVIICVLIAAVIWGFVKYLEKNNEVTQFEVARKAVVKKIQSEAKIISQIVDAKGLQTTLLDITDNKVLPEQVHESTGKRDIIDTTAMALDIRTQQLQEIKIINATISAENLKLRKQINENNKAFYTYNSPFLNLKFTPPVNDQDSTDQGTADVSANVKISDVRYKKGNWFVGKKSVLSIRSDNPMFKLNGVNYLEFPENEKRFGLKAEGSTSWNSRIGFAAGPALKLQAGRFSVEGNYLWYQDFKEWIPGGKVNFELFNIGK